MTWLVIIHKRFQRRCHACPWKSATILNALIPEIKFYWACPAQLAKLWKTG